MHARPAGPTLLQRPGRQTYGKGSVLHGTGPSFPSAALSSPTRILLVHERGDHAPQPLHGGIPMSALVPDELRNPFLRTLLGKRQNPEFIRARDFTRKRLGTGQAEVGTPHHLHGAEEVRRSHRTRPCDPGLGNRRVHCPKHPFGARSDFHVSVRKTLFERECARLVEPSGQRMTASHDESGRHAQPSGARSMGKITETAAGSLPLQWRGCLGSPDRLSGAPRPSRLRWARA